MVLSRVLWKVHSKDHAVAALSSRRHAGQRSRQPRYTTIRDATGVVSTLIKVTTGVVAHTPWWPFGHVITDSLDDPAALTRRHLLTHPSNRWGTRDEDLTRDESLTLRARDVETRANALLPILLSDAPALRLTLGDDAAWFAGESCTWTATRFHDDQAIPLHRLSSAERRWANVAIRGATGLSLESIYEMQNLDTATWLVIDEPERGLHRTAESHMARGLQELARRGIQP